MRYLISLFFIANCAVQLHAQTYEIGGIIGGANIIADVGKTTYINPNNIAAGILFKWNRSPRHAFRFSYVHASLNTDDADGSDGRRQQRQYNLKSSVDEASLGIEFNFWDYDTYGGQAVGTPYLYTGLTYFIYSGTLEQPDPRDTFTFGIEGSFAVPIILGYKTTLSTNFVIAAEIGARYTLTDNIDGSAPNNNNNKRLPTFGNTNNNDWYVITGITLTYTFGRKPCYCNF